ncbi:MAG: hypothetical protein RSE00_05070 [Clostridia bacterium]
MKDIDKILESLKKGEKIDNDAIEKVKYSYNIIDKVGLKKDILYIINSIYADCSVDEMFFEIFNYIEQKVKLRNNYFEIQGIKLYKCLAGFDIFDDEELLQDLGRE